MSAPGSKAGFSLVGLSVMVLVLLVLAALFVPAIVKARRWMRTSACLGQARQLGFAMDLYASDHDDRFPPNQPGIEVPQGQTWVQGWMGWSGPDCTNVGLLRESLLAPYVRGTSKWRCPEAGPVRMARHTVTKVRSFSINGFVGSAVVSPLAATFRKRSDVAPVSPSRLLAFVEERPETLNDGTFEMQWDFDVSKPWQWILGDQPAVNHGLAGNLTWVDGHAETHPWLDMPRTPRSRASHPAPGHPDVLWLQGHGTWRPQAHTGTRHNAPTMP